MPPGSFLPTRQTQCWGTSRIQPSGQHPHEAGRAAATGRGCRLAILQSPFERFDFATQPFDLASQVVAVGPLLPRPEVSLPGARTTVHTGAEVGATDIRSAIMSWAEVRMPSLGAAAAVTTEIGMPPFMSTVVRGIVPARALPAAPLGVVAVVRTAVVVKVRVMPLLGTTVELGVMPAVVATAAAIELGPVALLAIALGNVLVMVGLTLRVSEARPVATLVRAKAAELVRTPAVSLLPGRAAATIAKAVEGRSRATVVLRGTRPPIGATVRTTGCGVAIAFAAGFRLRRPLAIAVFFGRAGFAVAVALGASLSITGPLALGPGVRLARGILGRRGFHFVQRSQVLIGELGLDRFDLALRFAQFALQLLDLLLGISVLSVDRAASGQRRRKCNR